MNCLRTLDDNRDLRTYSFVGSDTCMFVLAAPVFFCCFRDSSFISTPKISLNLTCASAMTYVETLARLSSGATLERCSESFGFCTGAPSRYCEKSMYRITSETSLCFSC